MVKLRQQSIILIREYLGKITAQYLVTTPSLAEVTSLTGSHTQVLHTLWQVTTVVTVSETPPSDPTPVTSSMTPMVRRGQASVAPHHC